VETLNQIPDLLAKLHNPVNVKHLSIRSSKTAVAADNVEQLVKAFANRFPLHGLQSLRLQVDDNYPVKN
jgi:hypothetical protein